MYLATLIAYLLSYVIDIIIFVKGKNFKGEDMVRGKTALTVASSSVGQINHYKIGRFKN